MFIGSRVFILTLANIKCTIYTLYNPHRANMWYRLTLPFFLFSEMG